MKREILFRGKRVDNGKWVYGNLIGNDAIVGEIVEFDEDYFTTEFWYKVDPETVGMFTGMEDSLTLRIFEGDIVRYTRETLNGTESTVHEVYFDTELFQFGLKNSNELFNFQFSNEFEVIGNAYDNPELIKP